MAPLVFPATFFFFLLMCGNSRFVASELAKKTRKGATQYMRIPFFFFFFAGRLAKLANSHNSFPPTSSRNVEKKVRRPLFSRMGKDH